MDYNVGFEEQAVVEFSGLWFKVRVWTDLCTYSIGLIHNSILTGFGMQGDSSRGKSVGTFEQ